MAKSYQNQRLVSRLFDLISKIFLSKLSKPTLLNLIGMVLAVICISGTASIRNFFNWFLRPYWGKKLNTYYHTLKVLGEKLDILEFSVVQWILSFDTITGTSKEYPILFFADDTIQPKYGKKFEYVKVLHDHAMHTGKVYVNAHSFVTLTIAFPIKNDSKVEYVMFPFAMRMYIPDQKTKLEMVSEMAERAIKAFDDDQHIILECDSWYPKGEVLQFVMNHDNVDLIANIRRDSALYKKPTRTGKRGRPRKYGDKFGINDIVITDDNGTFKAGMTPCLTKIFDKPVYAIRTKNSDKSEGRLFISTIAPDELPELDSEIIGLWRILEYYDQRWSIETYFYELKKFWSFGSYQVRSQREIEGLNFVTTFTYILTRILPVVDKDFAVLSSEGTSTRKNALGRIILEEQIFDSLALEPKMAKNKRSNMWAIFLVPLKNKIESHFL